jgi:hypothetical protein
VPDPLLLKLPTVADAEAANDLLRRLSSTVGTPLHLKRPSVMSWWVVDNAGSPLETAELDALAVRLAAEPEVEVTELNRILTPSAQDVAVEEEPSGERLETRVGVDRRRDHFRGPGELHEVEQVVQRLPKKR